MCDLLVYLLLQIAGLSIVKKNDDFQDFLGKNYKNQRFFAIDLQLRIY